MNSNQIQQIRLLLTELDTSDPRYFRLQVAFDILLDSEGNEIYENWGGYTFIGSLKYMSSSQEGEFFYGTDHMISEDDLYDAKPISEVCLFRENITVQLELKVFLSFDESDFQQYAYSLNLNTVGFENTTVLLVKSSSSEDLYLKVQVAENTNTSLGEEYDVDDPYEITPLPNFGYLKQLYPGFEIHNASDKSTILSSSIIQGRDQTFGICIGPNGILAVYLRDKNEIQVFDLNSSQTKIKVQDLSPIFEIEEAQFDPSGERLALKDGKLIKVIDVVTGNYILEKDIDKLELDSCHFQFENNVIHIKNEEGIHSLNLASGVLEYIEISTNNRINLSRSYLTSILVWTEPINEVKFSVSQVRWFNLSNGKSGQTFFPLEYGCDIQVLNEQFVLIYSRKIYLLDISIKSLTFIYESSVALENPFVEINKHNCKVWLQSIKDPSFVEFEL